MTPTTPVAIFFPTPAKDGIRSRPFSRQVSKQAFNHHPLHNLTSWLASAPHHAHQPRLARAIHPSNHHRIRARHPAHPHTAHRTGPLEAQPEGHQLHNRLPARPWIPGAVSTLLHSGHVVCTVHHGGVYCSGVTCGCPGGGGRLGCGEG